MKQQKNVIIIHLLVFALRTNINIIQDVNNHFNKIMNVTKYKKIYHKVTSKFHIKIKKFKAKLYLKMKKISITKS